MPKCEVGNPSAPTIYASLDLRSRRSASAAAHAFSVMAEITMSVFVGALSLAVATCLSQATFRSFAAQGREALSAARHPLPTSSLGTQA